MSNFNKHNNVKLLVETKKAVLLKFKNGAECWVPKSLCKGYYTSTCYIYEFFDLNISKPVENVEFEILIDEPIKNNITIDKPSNVSNIDLTTHYSDGSLRESLPF